MRILEDSNLFRSNTNREFYCKRIPTTTKDQPIKSRSRKETSVVGLALAFLILSSSFAVLGLSPNRAAVAAPSCVQLTPVGATASSYSAPFSPGLAIDGNLDYHSRWAAYGAGQYIDIKLPSASTICAVDIAWYRGNARVYSFDISGSADGSQFTKVFSGKNTGKTPSFEAYTLPPSTTGSYVRITVNGNTENSWAGIKEVKIIGFTDSTSPPPTLPTTVSITTPTSGQSFNTTLGDSSVWLNVSGTTTNRGAGVQGVEVSVDSGPYQGANPGGYGWATWTTIANLSAIAGPHTITARVSDLSGNSSTDSVTVSLAAPSPPPPVPPPTNGSFALSIFPVGTRPTAAQVAQLAPYVDQAAQFGPSPPSTATPAFLSLWISYSSITKIVVTPSAANIDNTIATARNTPGTGYIVYDAEGWTLTPTNEQTNLASYIDSTATTVHAAGFKYGIAPTRGFLESVKNSIDWSKIDLVIIQLQNVPDDATFMQVVKDVVPIAQAQNPNIQIFLQQRPDPAHNPSEDIITRWTDARSAYPAGNIGLAFLYDAAQQQYILDLLTALGKK